MCEPLKTPRVNKKKLTAPHMPITAEPGPVERNADNLFFQTVFTHNACDVGMMVLNRNVANSAQLLGILRGKISGVQVVGNNGRSCFAPL